MCVCCVCEVCMCECDVCEGYAWICVRGVHV